MKNCPYCGEEILDVAKKCKHCGEWLPQTDIPTPSPAGKQQMGSSATNATVVAPTIDIRPVTDDTHVQTFISPYALVLCFLGVLGCGLSFFDSYVGAAGVALSSFVSLILFYAFYKGMKLHAKPVGWPLILILIELGLSCIVSCIWFLLNPEEFLEMINEPWGLYDLIFMVLVLIPWMVLGGRLSLNYTANTSRLGWAILTMIGVEILSVCNELVILGNIKLGIYIIVPFFIIVINLAVRCIGLIIRIIWWRATRNKSQSERNIKQAKHIASLKENLKALAVCMIVWLAFAGSNVFSILENLALCLLFIRFYLLLKSKAESQPSEQNV